MHDFKKSKIETTSNHSRHVKHRETLVPRYVGFMQYLMRVKTIIQKFQLLGISISYDWCLSICDQFVISIFKKYDDNKVFVHTAIASSYYHGIIFSIMQFLTTMNCEVLQEKPYNLSENSKSKLTLPIFCLRLTLNSNHFHFDQAPLSVTLPLC